MQVEVQAFLSSLESQPCYSKSTRLAYSSDLNYFVDYLQKTLRRTPILSDFNSDQIARFLESESQAGRRRSTLLRRRATIRRFSEYLHSEGLIEIDFSKPGSSIPGNLPSPGAPPLPQTILTMEHLKILSDIFLTAQRPLARRDYAIFSILLETGMSVSNLILLNLNDLDLHAGKVHLSPEIGKDYWLSMGEAAGNIALYLREGRPELNPSIDEPALFISQTGARMSRQSIWQVLRHWGRIANLPVELSPRVIRHTAALRLANKGLPLSEIQNLLGHTNPLSTLALFQRLKASFSG